MLFDDLENMHAIEEIEEIEESTTRPHRFGHYDHGQDFVEKAFAMNNEEFKSRYRVTKESFKQIMDLVIFEVFICIIQAYTTENTTWAAHCMDF